VDTENVVVAWPKKVLISIVLLICGVLVFILGTNWYSVFPTNDSQIYRAVIAAVFLMAALILRRRESAAQYSRIAYAFFIATVAFFVTSLTAEIRDDLLHALNITFDSPRHLALSKVFESTIVLSTTIVLTLLWGDDLGSLYIKKGRLGLSLFIGLSLMTINTATGVVTGVTLGQAGEEVIARLPWVLLTSLANGLMEEVWFRGLFLRKFASVIGMTGSIVVTSVVFTVLHSYASYMNPIEAIIFQVIIFPMALLLAWLMHKSDTVWGSALYHAGSDAFMFYLMFG
jgi:membrane protease YdiL (CAAX protease family)